MSPLEPVVPLQQMLSDGTIRHVNMYDTLRFYDGSPSFYERLFGNTHIGMAELTNLQVGGQLGWGGWNDCLVFVQNWYARTNVKLEDTSSIDGSKHFSYSHQRFLWESLLHSTVVDFIINERPIWTLNLFDLVRNHRYAREGEEAKDTVIGYPWPIVVPSRSNVSVVVNFHNRSVLDQVRAFLLFERNESRSDVEPRIWIHLEGLSVRSEGRVGHYVASILESLIPAQAKKGYSIADRIADWVMSLCDSTSGVEDAAIVQLNAVSDGIREGLWAQTPIRTKKA